MLSKSQISLITSLSRKKFRVAHGLFLVEGVKSILEFLNSTYQVETIYATDFAATKLGKIPQKIKFQQINDLESKKISQLSHPQGALALVRIPKPGVVGEDFGLGKHTLVLDDIQDPGNLGTIIRTAEWFGFENILCSKDTVDVYNPKVVQATMGSLSRVGVIYTDLVQYLTNTSLPKYGAVLDGESIYKTSFGDESLIVLGNEGNGISDEILAHINCKVTIPSLGEAESLNVAVAATVFCSEVVRRNFF